MNDQPERKQSASDKAATYIARAITGLLGIGLLVLFVTELRATANLKIWLSFMFMICLFLGYGLGIDIWGVKLLDLIAGRNNRRFFEKGGAPTVSVMSRMMFCFLVIVLVLLVALLITVLWRKLHAV